MFEGPGLFHTLICLVLAIIELVGCPCLESECSSWALGLMRNTVLLAHEH